MQTASDFEITSVSFNQDLIPLLGLAAPSGFETASPMQPPRPAAPNLARAHALVHKTWWTSGDHFPCLTGAQRDVRGGKEVYPESFTAMVIADLLQGQAEQSPVVASVVEMLEDELTPEGLFYFFKEHDRLPADADCTALGLSVLLLNGAPVWQRAHLALDHIIANVGERGVVETYFGAEGRTGIIDPVVCANVLVLAHLLGREDEVWPTMTYVRDVLVESTYEQGTRYYHGPDTFLYFLGRLVRLFPATHGMLLEPLRQAIRDRQGATAHPIDLAQRSIIARWVGIDHADELETLVGLLEDDGVWGGDSLFRYGRKKIYFGSRVLSTAFALAALSETEQTTVPAAQPRPAPALF